MPRSASTSDVFTAIAEPQRRAILALLATGERSVGEVAESLHFQQPQASKHLQVLRTVGLVQVRRAAQQRLYGLNRTGLAPLLAWLERLEDLWQQRLNRLDVYLERLQTERQDP